MKKTIFISIVYTILSACSVDATKQNDINSSSLNNTSMVQMQYDDQLIPDGALFSWSPELKGVYKDDRFNHVDMDALLKQGIVNALVKKGYRFEENAASADYTVAYTAALESALSDGEVLQTFGSQPGLVTSPQPDQNTEKGTLIIDVINKTTGHLHWRSTGQVLAKLDKIPLEQRKQRVEQFLKLILLDLH